MKIAFTNDIKFGLNRFVAGDEIDIPDEKFAQALITAGHATEAGEKKPKKAAEAKEAKEETKAYKTRQIKAEDSD